tara:strand:- start:4116 stop:5048 length:933 start_codon:yes stop_codon:yes gene_type:complete
MENNLDSLPGLDKAAILFQVLGESLSLSMFQGISESDILRIRVRSKELINVPFDLKKSIVEEFYFKMMTQKYRQVDKSKKLFSFLDDLNDEQIYYLVSTESSRVIALTLDQLSDERKFTILNRFDSSAKHSIIIEFADLNDIPLEAVVNIAHELKKKIAFIPGPKEFTRGGAKSIASILNQMSMDDSSQYLTQIENDDPELFAKVKKYFLSFDDLLDMPDHVMRNFWRNPEIDIDILAKSLKGIDESVIENILSFLPKRKQGMFAPITEPLSKKDSEDSKLAMLQIAKSMGKSGELKIEDILSSEDDMID